MSTATTTIVTHDSDPLLFDMLMHCCGRNTVTDANGTEWTVYFIELHCTAAEVTAKYNRDPEYFVVKEWNIVDN